MYAALCHDLGKPLTTGYSDGKLRSLGHCEAGEVPTRALLGRLTREQSFVDGIVMLVVNHLAPTAFHEGVSGPSAIRRLAKKLEPEVNIGLLVRLARADHFGRGQEPDFPRVFPAGDWLLARATELAVKDAAEAPILMGRHLLAAGQLPGPSIGKMLKRAYEIQINEGIRDVDVLLQRVLGDCSQPLPYRRDV